MLKFTRHHKDDRYLNLQVIKQKQTGSLKCMRTKFENKDYEQSVMTCKKEKLKNIYNFLDSKRHI